MLVDLVADQSPGRPKRNKILESRWIFLRWVVPVTAVAGRSRAVGRPQQDRRENDSVDAEVAAEFGDVAGRADVVLGQFDLALLVHDESRTQDAGDGLAVQLLLAESAV
jgi:hypothetical protein